MDRRAVGYDQGRDLEIPDEQWVEIRRLKVYAVRVVKQSLGVMYAGDWSENHVVIYLLIGRNESVRLDMRPLGGQEGQQTESHLNIKRQFHILSHDALAHVDIKTTVPHQGPSESQPQTPAQAGMASVATFIDAIVTPLSNVSYWFIDMGEDGGVVGCRHFW
jgi:hypothetical protein